MLDSVNAHLRRAHQAALEDPFHHVPFEFFMRTLPAVKDLDEICSELVSQSTLLSETGWHDFQSLMGIESTVYNKAMERICKVSIDASAKVAAMKRKAASQKPRDLPAHPTEDDHVPRSEVMYEERMKLHCDGNNGIVAERMSLHWPGAGLTFIGDHCKSLQPSTQCMERQLHVEDVFACAEYKRKGSDADDYHAKIMCDGLLLVKDPCRRFTFGFTIEDVDTSLYYFSRGFVLKSESFNMNKEYKKIIHFFTALAQATDEQLGWDPTVKRTRDRENKTYYLFKVGDRWYRHLECLADFRANDLTGRGTRVWKVVQTVEKDGKWEDVNTTKHYALKDMWIDSQEKQEAITIKTIRALCNKWTMEYPGAPDASNHEKAPDDGYIFREEWLDELESSAEYGPDAAPVADGEDWNASYNRYFPKIVDHGFVRLSNGKVDKGSACLTDEDLARLRTHDFPTDYHLEEEAKKNRAPLSSINKGSTISMTSGLPAPIITEKKPKRPAWFRDTFHYRELMDDVATTLFGATSMNMILEGLRDTAIGLRWLFRAGHIHRDLSLGNLLRLNEPSIPSFGSVTQLSDFEYCRPIKPKPGRSGGGKAGTPDFMAHEVHTGKWAFGPPQSLVDENADLAPKPPIFLATPLHDIESILWMLVWTLVQRSMTHTPQLESWQSSAYDHIFGPTGAAKGHFLEQPNRQTATELLREVLDIQPLLRPLAIRMMDLHLIILQAHREYQSDPSFNQFAYGDNQAIRKVVAFFSNLELTANVPFALSPSPEKQAPLDKTQLSADKANSVDVSTTSTSAQKKRSRSVSPSGN